MKKNKKILAIILALVMCLGLLAACGGNDDPPPANTGGGGDSPPPANDTTSPSQPPAADDPGGVDMGQAAEGGNYAEEVRIIVDNNPINVVNPFLPASNNTSTNSVFTMIYDRLLYPEDDGTFSPELASVETSDYTTYSFVLRDDVVFHNGDKLTARDVEFTINTAKDSPGSPSADAWRLVETINIHSDTEFDLVLGEMNVDFLFGLTRPASGIVNQNAMSADAEKGPWVGTGAFSIIDFETGDFVYMQRNDNWWNTANAPVTERMHLRFVPEMGARAIMVQNGEAQISLGTSAEDLPIFENDPDNYNVYRVTFNDPQGMAFNMTDTLMQDKNFRLAVLHAIDLDEVAVVAAGKWASGANESGNFWGLTTEFRHPDLPYIGYDPELAKEYLAASSYVPGTVVEIATAIITNIRGSEVIQACLEDIGITVEVNQMDSPTLNAYIAGGQGQINVIFTTITPSAASVRAAFVPGGGQNRSNYSNPEVTALFDEASKTIDREARRDIYYRIQEIIYDELPVHNVIWRHNGIVIHNNIGGLILRSDAHRHDYRGVYYTLDG